LLGLIVLHVGDERGSITSGVIEPRARHAGWLGRWIDEGTVPSPLKGTCR
jgi:hypothetical protein